MAKAFQNVEVTLDRQARDSIRSLVNAIDRLSAAIVNGEGVEALASDPENVEVLRRLVEDVKSKDKVKFAQGGYVLPTGNKGRGGVR